MQPGLAICSLIFPNYISTLQSRGFPQGRDDLNAPCNCGVHTVDRRLPPRWSINHQSVMSKTRCHPFTTCGAGPINHRATPSSQQSSYFVYYNLASSAASIPQPNLHLPQYSIFVQYLQSFHCTFPPMRPGSPSNRLYM
jgi:hypothetical protein